MFQKEKAKARKEFDKYQPFLTEKEFLAAKERFDAILESEEISEENLRHCYGRIFPMIAIYEALKENNPDDDNLARAEEIFNDKEVFPGIEKMQKLMKFSFLYKLIFPLIDKFMAKAYRQSPDGFQIETIKAEDDAYIFKIHQCPYFNYCKKYDVPELCDIFCKSDDLSGNAMQPHIQFDRDSTIARGSDYCDFSYKLKK